MERLLPVGAARRIYADGHEAAVRQCDMSLPEWLLYEVLRSWGFHNTTGDLELEKVRY